MCGLVAYAGPGAEMVNLAVAAREAARRGPHSWGWAWWDGKAWQVERGRGPLGVPCTAVVGAAAVIGHSRLATCGSAPGDAPPPEETQPFIRAEHLIAHNGTVAAPQALAGREVVVDSEAILDALAKPLTTAWTIEEVLGQLGDAPQALVYARGPDVYVARRGGGRRPAHPLFGSVLDGGCYVASRPFSEGCRPLPEGVRKL